MKRNKKKMAVMLAAVLLVPGLVGEISMSGGGSAGLSDFQLSASAYSGGNYRVDTPSGVNVRSGAGVGYAKKGAAANGTDFTVTEINGSWGKTDSINCTNGCQSGWVCLKYCSYIGDGGGGGSSDGRTGNGVVYNCSALNVREGPSTSDNIKDTIRCGTAVYISSTSGNWGYDTIHNGYVNLNYINFSGGGGGSSESYQKLDTHCAYWFEPMCAPGKCVDVKAWGKTNCTNVEIYQMFVPVDLGNGYYAFVDKNSGKVLDIEGGYAYDCANVIIYEFHGGDNQQWRIRYAGAANGHDYFYIQSKADPNYYLDVNGASSENCSNIQVYHGNDTSAQKYVLWYISDSGTDIKPDSGHSSFKPLQQSNYNNQMCSKCGATFASSGCGPMATINAVGYLTGKQMDLETVAGVCRDKQVHCCGKGSYHSVACTLAKSLGSTYGFHVTDDYAFGNDPSESKYQSVWSDMVSHLQQGEVCVTLVPGHFIAIVAYDRSTDRVLVYDSAASSSNGTTTNGDWKSYNELNPHSSEGKAKLKLRAHITFLARS
jgi:uncharacterized protein YraI